MGRTKRTMLLVTAMVSLGACGGGHQQNAGEVDTAAAPPAQTSPGYSAAPDTTATATHHSKLKGALVGGVVGHYAGGHALAGAAAGALVQHERNKHH